MIFKHQIFIFIYEPCTYVVAKKDLSRFLTQALPMSSSVYLPKTSTLRDLDTLQRMNRLLYAKIDLS